MVIVIIQAFNNFCGYSSRKGINNMNMFIKDRQGGKVLESYFEIRCIFPATSTLYHILFSGICWVPRWLGMLWLSLYIKIKAILSLSYFFEVELIFKFQDRIEYMESPINWVYDLDSFYKYLNNFLLWTSFRSEIRPQF